MATRGKASAALRLPERFTVETAAQVLEDIRARLAKGGKLTIDLSDVCTVDTAGLQLLAVVRRQLSLDGQECEIKSVSDALKDNARLLGVAGILEWA
jgi:anti-anti-sigma regulatory factor